MPAWNLGLPGLCWVGGGEGCWVGPLCPLQGGHSGSWGGWRWRDKGPNGSPAAPSTTVPADPAASWAPLSIRPPTPGFRPHLFSPGPLEATPLQPTLYLLQGPLTTVPDATPAIRPCHHLQRRFLWPTSWPGRQFQLPLSTPASPAPRISDPTSMRTSSHTASLPRIPAVGWSLGAGQKHKETGHRGLGLHAQVPGSFHRRNTCLCVLTP